MVKWQDRLVIMMSLILCSLLSGAIALLSNKHKINDVIMTFFTWIECSIRLPYVQLNGGDLLFDEPKCVEKTSLAQICPQPDGNILKLPVRFFTKYNLYLKPDIFHVYGRFAKTYRKRERTHYYTRGCRKLWRIAVCESLWKPSFALLCVWCLCLTMRDSRTL